MNCLDYWLAQEFCVWDGGRLPTEAEWEFAARGSAADGLVPGRIFPWGDTAPSCDRVHFTGCSGEDGRRTRQVGRFAATAGLFDMAGNVWEWIADNYLEYPMCRGSGIDVLCSYSPTANRVFRGGSRSSDATSIRAASRFDFSPVLRNGAFGFRCARDTAL
jgi:formylglycine-generating enzyme required for sulfatase activity